MRKKVGSSPAPKFNKSSGIPTSREKFEVGSVVIALSLMQTGCFAQQAVSVASKEQELKDPNSWDFGQVKEGEVLRHEFLLKNETAKTLNIREIHTSCGCTASEVKKKTLLPRESTAIEVKFDSKGYSGQTQQFIYVHTDTIDASTSSLDFARDDPERAKRVEGPLSVNGERPSTSLRTALSERSESNGRSRTIDNPIIRYIIKAEVVK